MNQPNIVLINCDDMGYGDLGCYGSTVNETPFLDFLASQGMRFTDCYAASPVCSPSRAALMTGCYPPRVGINRVLFPGEAMGLNPGEYTMAQMLRDAGYRTMLVGKWHCGDQEEFLPCQCGFDRYYGLPYSNDMGRQTGREEFPPLPLLSGNQVIQQQPDQRSLTERYGEKCIEFIRENAGKPFFLYFAQMHVHLPLYAQEQFVRQSKNGDFGACMAEVDWVCASIYEELRSQGLLEKTLLLFTSDNGSRADHGASNGPLRGTKFTTWEGGQRVPLIAYWSGHIPAGTVQHGIISHIDFLPTFAALTGAELPKNKIDGVDQSASFWDPKVHCRDTMAYFGPIGFDEWKDSGNFNAYRWKNWKLHFRTDQGDSPMLFRLDSDIGESRDCLEQHPQIASKIIRMAEPLRKELGDAAACIGGTECRPCGKVSAPKPLTEYDENHPYIIAMYDKNDCG